MKLLPLTLIITLFAITSIATNANAGTNISLECKNRGSTIRVAGDIPGEFYPEYNLSVKFRENNRPQEIKHYAEIWTETLKRNARISINEDLDNGVLSFVSEELDDENLAATQVKLYALPKSVRPIRQQKNEKRYRFEAQISIKNGDNYLNDKMVCLTKQDL
ncbi:MAG: hypothetical protein M9962_02560 [Oligoflexia bacterium]|nr:hypothetical protein [Oligoflexia bacterium]